MDDFDKKFNQMWVMQIAFMVISFLIGLGILMFLGWVIVMTMRHIGII